MVYMSVSPTGAMGWSTVLVVPIWGSIGVDVGGAGLGVGVEVGGRVSVGGAVGVATWVGQPITSCAIVPAPPVRATVRSSPVESVVAGAGAGAGAGNGAGSGMSVGAGAVVGSGATGVSVGCGVAVACGVFVGRGVAVGGTGVFVAWMDGVATRVEVSDAAAVPVFVAVAVVVPPGVRVTLGEAVTVSSKGLTTGQ